MPSWDRVRAELTRAAEEALPPGQSHFDVVRRKKLKALSEVLDRPVVLYAVDCLGPSPKTQPLQQLLGPVATMIEPGDKDGFSEALEELDGDRVAVVLQSPGGFAEAAEALVEQIRAQFEHVAFIVPAFAKSAATMLALSGDELYLDERSELGPIDPQFNFPDGRTSPALAILRQFERAEAEIQEDGGKLPAWVPILQQYAPSLLEDARDALNLAQRMVAGWLERYMLAGEDNAGDRARAIAAYFAGEDVGEPIGSHSRPIGIERALQVGLKVEDMRAVPALKSAVMDLHHVVNITFAETGAYKIVENQNGDAFIRSLQVNVQLGPGPPGAPPPGLLPPGGPAPKKPPPPPPKKKRRK